MQYVVSTDTPVITTKMGCTTRDWRPHASLVAAWRLEDLKMGWLARGLTSCLESTFDAWALVECGLLRLAGLSHARLHHVLMALLISLSIYLAVAYLALGYIIAGVLPIGYALLALYCVRSGIGALDHGEALIMVSVSTLIFLTEVIEAGMARTPVSVLAAAHGACMTLSCITGAELNDPEAKEDDRTDE